MRIIIQINKSNKQIQNLNNIQYKNLIINLFQYWKIITSLYHHFRIRKFLTLLKAIQWLYIIVLFKILHLKIKKMGTIMKIMIKLFKKMIQVVIAAVWLCHKHLVDFFLILSKVWRKKMQLYSKSSKNYLGINNDIYVYIHNYKIILAKFKLIIVKFYIISGILNLFHFIVL